MHTDAYKKPISSVPINVYLVVYFEHVNIFYWRIMPMHELKHCQKCVWGKNVDLNVIFKVLNKKLKGTL